LHELYNALFPEKATDDLIPGRIAGVYADHLILNGDHICPYCPKDVIMKEIMKRNQIDILQMIEICSQISSFE